MANIDYQGIAIVIGALGTLVVTIGNAALSWRQSKKAEINKNEAIAARTEQTQKIDHITHLVNNRSDQQDAKIDDLTKKLASANTALDNSGKGPA